MMNCIFIRQYVPHVLLLVVGFCRAHEENTVFYDGSLQALYNHATTECKKGHYIQAKELFSALASDERFSQLTQSQQHQLLYNKGNAEFLADDLSVAAATFERIAQQFNDTKAAQKYAYIKQLLEHKEQQERSQDDGSHSEQNNDQEQQSGQEQKGDGSCKNSSQTENNKKQENGNSQNSDVKNSGQNSQDSAQSQSQNAGSDSASQRNEQKKESDDPMCGQDQNGHISDTKDCGDEPHQKNDERHGERVKQEPTKKTDVKEDKKNELQNNPGGYKNDARDTKQNMAQQHAAPYKAERPQDKLYAALAERDEHVQKAVIRGLVGAHDHNKQERDVRGHKTW